MVISNDYLYRPVHSEVNFFKRNVGRLKSYRFTSVLVTTCKAYETADARDFQRTHLNI